MEKKEGFGSFVSSAGKAAKGLLNRSADLAAKVADQNGDGKFDLQDVSIMADSMGNAMKKGAQAIRANAEEFSRQQELKALAPVFRETLDDVGFSMPKFIRIAQRDKKHAESEVCQGSIGFYSEQKGIRLLNIFQDSLSDFGLSFYPDRDCEFYYVDPTDRDHYIALDDYFSHLKVARVNELQKIAQDLGAKHFTVTYKEERTSFSSRDAKGKISTPAGGAEVIQDCSEQKFSTVEIAAKNDFPGHAPVMPQLRYLQRDPSIQALVAMRMNPSAPLLHQTYLLKMSNSSGMKESDAIKIDAILKGMKCVGNATVASEAKNESRRYLEYEIVF